LSNEIIEKIEKIKRQRNAVILAHNYQPDEVQDVADYQGDSLGLSVQAAKTDAEIIVFCGVLFMAETAAILSPDKTVIMPDKNAGCPMADMITGEQLRELKAKHPDAVVVCYVNSSADVKAQSDYCCTSSNAIEVVNSIDADKKIIFVPDRYLGQHVAEYTDREIILWPGYCPTHVRITVTDIKNARAEHPDAIVMVHPECTQEVRHAADERLSTGQMLVFAKESANKSFIVGTEVGIIHALKKENPDKEFFAATKKAVCPNMKKTTLEKVLWSLEDLEYKITVPKDVTAKAKTALDRMIEVLPAL